MAFRRTGIRRSIVWTVTGAFAIALVGCVDEKAAESKAKKQRCKLASQCEFLPAQGPRGGTNPIGAAVDLARLFPLRCPPGASVGVQFDAPGVNDSMTVEVAGSTLITRNGRPSPALGAAVQAAQNGAVAGSTTVQVSAKVTVLPPDPACRTARADDALFFQDPVAMLANQMTNGIPADVAAANVNASLPAGSTAAVDANGAVADRIVCSSGHCARPPGI